MASIPNRVLDLLLTGNRYATSRYFSGVFGHIIKRDAGDNIVRNLNERDDDNNVLIYGNELDQDPDIACSASFAPAVYDCQSIVPDTDGNPDLVNNCYTKGTKKWCDLQGNGACQVCFTSQCPSKARR